MTSMTCFTRACARLSQRRLCVDCARFLDGDMHVGEIRLPAHMHILKIHSIHVSVLRGPALKWFSSPHRSKPRIPAAIT